MTIRSLNCIFLIDGINCASNARLVYGLEEDVWEEMIKQCDTRYIIKDLPMDTTTCITEFAKVAIIFFFKCVIQGPSVSIYKQTLHL